MLDLVFALDKEWRTDLQVDFEKAGLNVALHSLKKGIDLDSLNMMKAKFKADDHNGDGKLLKDR